MAGGRLAVGAGDADERRLAEQAPAELDLAPDRQPTAARPCDEGRLARHARALHDGVDVVQQGGVLRAPVDFDAGLREPAGVGVGRAVGGGDAHAATGERERGRAPRAREPDDEHACGQLAQFRAPKKSKK
jgi:hypothetical protein